MNIIKAILIALGICALGFVISASRAHGQTVPPASQKPTVDQLQSQVAQDQSVITTLRSQRDDLATKLLDSGIQINYLQSQLKSAQDQVAKLTPVPAHPANKP